MAEGTRASLAVPGGRNIVLAALTGPHAPFAVSVGKAMRYSATVAPFATLPDEPSAADWADLAALAADRTVILIRPLPPLPPGWQRVAGWPVYQMVYAGVGPAAQDATGVAAGSGNAVELDLRSQAVVAGEAGNPTSSIPGAGDPGGGADDGDPIQELGRADVDDIRELVQLTRPGPFLADTIELGRYVGIRRGGQLVAMAGERFRVPRATEVSAICTHPDHRGQGLAERLTMTIIEAIRARGEVAFLHVITDNTPAVRLYEKLGFVVGLEFDAIAVQAPGSEGTDTSELTVH